MIPKKLHFTFGTKDLPKVYRDNLARWQRACPKWEHCFYTDLDIYAFFKTHFPHYYKELEKIPYKVVLADCFRYAVLFVYGGCYTDIDTFPLQELPEKWLFYQCVVGYEYQPSKFPELFRPTKGHRETLCQWTLLSEPSHFLYERALAEAFTRLKRANYQLKTASHILEATGPYMMTDVFERYQYQNQKTLLLLDADYFSCGDQRDFLPTHRSVVYHQYHGANRWMVELKLPHLDFGYREHMQRDAQLPID